MKRTYRNAIFRDLRERLLASLDDESRFEWSVRAEQLLEGIDPRREYDAAALRAALGTCVSQATGESIDGGRAVLAAGGEPSGTPGAAELPEKIDLLEKIDGRLLREDLASLIRDICDATVVPASLVGDEMFTADELAARWNVSSKTLTRWRRQGLIARRFLLDGRIRVGYLRATAERFAAHHPDLLQRGDRFSRLSDVERRAILVRAGQLSKKYASRAEIIAQLVDETSRSRETLRKLLEEHPEVAVAASERKPGERGLSEALEDRMLQEFRRGASPEEIAERHGCSRKEATRIVNRRRADEIAELPLDYMESEEFHSEDAEDTILAPLPEAEQTRRPRRPPEGLPPYLAQLYDYPLLTAEQERHLFRQYNYLKFRAERLRDQLDPKRPAASKLDAIEQDYQRAVAVKNQIIRANLRLVVSIAKKYTDAASSLFERVSEGNISLMRAVEKFDYTMGFKFSTYATWAIRKNFARSLANETRHSDRFRTSQEEMLDARPDWSSDPTLQLEAQRQRERHVKRIMRNLSDRERLIIHRRFGLGAGHEPRTLKELGVELGVSKERVRQLESRAMKKLRDAAADERKQSPGLWDQMAFSEN